MYPFDFKPTKNWIDYELIFVAMPFAPKYKNIFDLINKSVEIVNKKMKSDFKVWRADKDVTTQVGWEKILDQMMTSRLCIGVLTSHNPNVYYELGIAHATQQIDRQILLVPDDKSYLSKFDLQHLTYTEYDSLNPLVSSADLAIKIQDKLSYYNYQKERRLEEIISKLSLYEFKLISQIGLENHIGSLEILSDSIEQVNVFQAYRDLTKSGILRFSFNSVAGQYSYYFTELGNAVLHALGIIKEEELLIRNKSYRRNQSEGLFSVYNTI
jgi:hypothetical protein